jgi:hypothetical protein
MPPHPPPNELVQKNDPDPVDPDRFTQRVVNVLFTVFADNVSLEIHLAPRMPNLTPVENCGGCPTLR